MEVPKIWVQEDRAKLNQIWQSFKVLVNKWCKLGYWWIYSLRYSIILNSSSRWSMLTPKKIMPIICVQWLASWSILISFHIRILRRKKSSCEPTPHWWSMPFLSWSNVSRLILIEIKSRVETQIQRMARACRMWETDPGKQVLLQFKYHLLIICYCLFHKCSNSFSIWS